MGGLAKAKTHRDAAVRIVRVLQEAGFTAYLAGGCVRDDWLGRQPKDFDVATDATPLQVKQRFRYSRLVGEAFGVVIVPLYGHLTDVATFRSDGRYIDGRRPTQVHFTDAKHDAQRRDFTINGLFEDPLAQDPSDRFIDYVGGQRDLEAGVIRAIGDPRQRFAEDYLRMLRAVRFAARLGFDIEPATALAIREAAPKLAAISRERVGQELQWMLVSGQRSEGQDVTTGEPATVDMAGPMRAIHMLHDLGLDAPMLDEPASDAGLRTVAGLDGGALATILAAWLLERHFFTAMNDGHDADVVAHLDLRLAAFVQDRLAKIVRRWRTALCLSNDGRDALRGVITLLPTALRWDRLNLAQRKRLLADPSWCEATRLLASIGRRMGLHAWLDRVQLEMRTLIHQGVAPDPWIDGHDLIQLGLKPGPRFKVLLGQVYDAQLDGTLANRDEAMAWLRDRVEP